MLANLFPAIFIFSIFGCLSLLIDRILNRFNKYASAKESEVFQLVKNSQRFILFFIGSALALAKLGFDVSALVASLGLTGFALSFALKDAISNLIAGILVIIYKPFEINHIITIDGTKGKITDICLRYISIETEDATHLIPNAFILKKQITVWPTQE